MKAVKGVVMRIEKKSITVYSSEGDFLKIPPPGIKPAIGQVIEVGCKPRRLLIPFAAAAAVIILALALGMFGYIAGPEAAVAYVALDINPSIELYVNNNARVVTTRALNDEAGAVLSSVRLEGVDVYQALGLLVKETYAKGYIKKEDKNIVLASVIPLQNGAGSLVNEIKIRDTIYNKMKEQQITGFVVVNKAREEAEKEAEKMGLSVNKYLVYDRMSREGIQVTPEKFRSRSVRQVVEQSGARIDRLFPEESCEVGGNSKSYSGMPRSNGDGAAPLAAASQPGGPGGFHQDGGSRGDAEHGAGDVNRGPGDTAGNLQAGNSGAAATPRSDDDEHPRETPDAIRQPGPSLEEQHEGPNHE